MSAKSELRLYLTLVISSVFSRSRRLLTRSAGFLALFLIMFLFAPAYCAAEDTPNMQVRVYFDSRDEIRQLQAMHLDIVWCDENFVEVITDRDELGLIQAVGFATEIIHPDVVKFYQSRMAVKGMGNYKNLEEINQKIDSIVTSTPSIVSPKISIGQTIDGRDIWAFKISDNPTVDEEEPEVLYTACIHAREVITPEVLFYFIDHLTSNYGGDPDITWLVDNRELWFVPMVNPDGYFWNQVISPAGGGMWRKNRRNNGDGTYGVDLNRNFGYKWGYDNTGSSPDTDDQTYRGTGPFSEPETQTMRDFAESREFVVSVYYHSYSNLILWPWGYAEIYTPDEDIFAAMGDSLLYMNGYWPCPGWMLYLTNGDSDDWIYGEQTAKNKTFAFTMEVGDYMDGFWPPGNRIQALIHENLEPNLFYARVADNPFYADNAGNGFGACYSDEPLIVAPQEDTSLVITLSNNGYYSFDNNFYTSVAYNDGAGWISIIPPAGVIPYGEKNTIDLQVIVNAPAGAPDPSLWRATIRIHHDGLGSPNDIPVCLEVASDLMRPQSADLATVCKRFRIYNNGGLSKNAANASLDYIDDCDTFNVCTNPEIYLYEASPIICRLGDGGDTLRFTMYSKMLAAEDAFRPQSNLQVDSTTYPNFTYARAEYRTADDAVSLSSEYFVPKNEEACDFVVVTQTFRNLTGDTLFGALIGEFLDWNIPSDSGAENGSGCHIDTIVTTIHQPNDDTTYLATIYQFGAELYDSLMGDCGQYSDDRFGGIACDPRTLFKNAQTFNNAVYVDTNGPYGSQAPLPPGAMYRIMKENEGFNPYQPGDPYDFPNLSTLVTFGEYDLPPGVEYTYTYILVTTKTGLSNYLALVEAANEWVKAQPEIRRHCLDLAGDANNDGAVNLGDAVYVNNFVFHAGSPPPSCMAEGDANGDGLVNLGDAVYINNFVFCPGAPPPREGPEK